MKSFSLFLVQIVFYCFPKYTEHESLNSIRYDSYLESSSHQSQNSIFLNDFLYNCRISCWSFIGLFCCFYDPQRIRNAIRNNRSPKTDESSSCKFLPSCLLLRKYTVQIIESKEPREMASERSC